ncbi:MAG: succinate dehydrogenase, hydrophobic membrane anchor protein [Dokdonella sp.]|uniref:succinate dehydrogenase, hydrophobic membrane anchor protein n=1 Tax=Dokdonella sp. TaxID=2291710 RepID=UPI0025C44A47|nr:succinate dehydrogenase, hydrophobic membrane anchor protein [Dokdonella sp.]MBZ0222503.1 succinate dehydrogenase, hydrophobic membrane anchor protein [Dokdonella sp.]MCC7256091.1 succinate dehydrogenase, hydrophobic membrane anchor protein [Dokdonella sp.]
MSTPLRTPLKTALGLGSAKQGLHHFMVQRITAVALLLLVPWLIWLVLTLITLDFAAAHALLAQPWNASLLLVLVIAVFWHAQLGLQVVIEDYVHGKGSNLVLQLAVKLLCFLGAAAGVLAVLKIALGR